MALSCETVVRVLFTMAAWVSGASAACTGAGRDVPAGAPALSHPASGYLLSSHGLRRHPMLQTLRHHDGIDYAGAIGDPVRAAADGEVIFAGALGRYGSAVIVRHDPLHLETTYAHLSQIDVKTGDCVQQQQRIGAIGMSGISSGPRLHFEVREAADPMLHLPAFKQ